MISKDPWVAAREHLGCFGRIPPVFTLAIRSLMHDHYRGSEGFSPASMFLVNRLMRSPTMKAVVYYSVLTFHNEQVSNTPYLSSADLVRMYKPGDLAATIGLSYYFRAIRRHPSLDSASPAWSQLARVCATDIDLGGFVGYAVPEISAGLGFLAGGLLPLAHGVLFLRDPKGAEPYLLSMYEGGTDPDFEMEIGRWGCSSVQLASNMLQLIGFGMPWMNAALSAYGSLGGALPSQDERDKNFARLRFALFWIETLQRTGQAPLQKIPAAFYPTQKGLFRLLYQFNEIKDEGSRHEWIERGKGDISPGLTPQLFQEYLAETANSDELKAFVAEHIGGEILEGISEEDFEEVASKGGDPEF